MGKVLGIVGEYNPFHNGHLYHLEESKKITGSTYTVAIMSGNFTQRGSTSLIDKWSKAEMAIQNGIDLVIELPVLYATSSAENFAEGAIKTLNSLGIVDCLSFGAETSEINVLNKKDTVKFMGNYRVYERKNYHAVSGEINTFLKQYGNVEIKSKKIRDSGMKFTTVSFNFEL